MSRRAPIYPANTIIAQVQLDPNGGHRLDVATDNGILLASYGAEAVSKLEEAIKQFKAHTTRADGGPDFYHRKRVPLEV